MLLCDAEAAACGAGTVLSACTRTYLRWHGWTVCVCDSRILLPEFQHFTTKPSHHHPHSPPTVKGHSLNGSVLLQWSVVEDYCLQHFQT